MTQTPLKSKPLTARSKTKRHNGVTKRGARAITPKRTSLKKADNFQKKLSAQLTAATEKRLADRAGHLEILRGGKQDKRVKKET